MDNKEMDKVVVQKVSFKIQELKQWSPSDLLALPPYTAINFEVGGKMLELGIWHDTTEGGEALIVAQCKNTHFLGVGSMYAEGFVLNSEGIIKNAPEELMWEYT